MPLDRSSLPPDVARRLAVLAGHLPAAPASSVPGAAARPVTAPPVPVVGPSLVAVPSAAGDVLPVVVTGRDDDVLAGAGPSLPVPPTRQGWTPRPPRRARGAAGVPNEVDAAASTTPDGIEAVAVEHPQDPCTGTGPAGSAPAVGEPSWRPTVAGALATAAASSPLSPSPPAAPVRPRPRWVPGWRATGAAVLALALAGGALTLRAASAPRGEPVSLPTPAGSRGPLPGSADDVPTGEVSDQVVVHVVGAVAKPGVVRLPLGSRVSDAVASTGGSSPDADLAAVNLARVLADGEQLVVPVVGASPPTPAEGARADGLVDLNTADPAELEELPGVGPVLAGRIVQRRAERPFVTVDELDEVPGVGPALLDDLRPRVRV